MDPAVAESHHFVLLKLGYYLFLYSVVVSYLCRTWPLVKHEKQEFYLNSEYIIVYSMQRAFPLNLLKAVTHSSRSHKVPF